MANHKKSLKSRNSASDFWKACPVFGGAQQIAACCWACLGFPLKPKRVPSSKPQSHKGWHGHVSTYDLQNRRIFRLAKPTQDRVLAADKKTQHPTDLDSLKMGPSEVESDKPIIEMVYPTFQGNPQADVRNHFWLGLPLNPPLKQLNSAFSSPSRAKEKPVGRGLAFFAGMGASHGTFRIVGCPFWFPFRPTPNSVSPKALTLNTQEEPVK